MLLLYIPWFVATPWVIPLPEIAPVTVLGHTFDFPPDVQIHPFGLLVAAAVILGAFVAEHRAKKVGLDPMAISGLSGHVIIFGFVIGHVVDSLAYHPDVVAERPWLVLEIWNGLSSFGGFLGAIVGALIWQRRRSDRRSTWRGLSSTGGFLAAILEVLSSRRGRSDRPSLRIAADPIAYSFPFGWLLGRLGCFVTHDHPGRVTMFPLGVADYEVGYPPYQVRHDLGLYEVLWCLAMIPLFLWLGRRERPRGLFLGLLPVLYAPVRFGLDFLRATDLDSSDPRYFGLTPGHYSAVVLFVLGALVLVRTWRDPWPPIPASIALRSDQRAEPEPDHTDDRGGGEEHDSSDEHQRSDGGEREPDERGA